MSRPSNVVNIRDLPGEKRPRFTATPGVAAVVRLASAVTGLAPMGVSVRSVQPGFAGTNRHFHSIEEEWSYVLSGRGTLRIGPLRIAVRAGHFAAFQIDVGDVTTYPEAGRRRIGDLLQPP